MLDINKKKIAEKYKKFVILYYKCQGDAAMDLGISRSHLNKIINNRDYPSTGLLIRYPVTNGVTK